MRDFQLPGRSAAYAVDAAIAGAVIQGLCQPAMTSLGGDCFVLFKPAGTEEVIALNGSGRAPAAIDPDKLRAEGHQIMPVETVDTITVPGAVDAWMSIMSPETANRWPHFAACRPITGDWGWTRFWHRRLRRRAKVSW